MEKELRWKIGIMLSEHEMTDRDIDWFEENKERIEKCNDSKGAKKIREEFAMLRKEEGL